VGGAKGHSVTDVRKMPAAGSTPVAEHLTVSVVICSNRPGSLQAAVASVLANDAPLFELLIVAQGGDPDWAHRDLAPFSDDARLRIVYDPGRGLSRARNIGLRATTGDVILFTDDDCAVAADWITEHARLYPERPETMMVFGTVAPPPYDPSTGMVPTFDPISAAGTVRLRGRIALGMGANMSVRRTLVDRVGPFDELLGAGAPLHSCEDFDMALRATAAGGLVVADARPVVIHAGGVRAAGPEARALWQRDGFGLGALTAKQLRVRHWTGVGALTGFLGGMVLDAGRRVLRGRRPFGLAMSACLLKGGASGVIRGLRQPLARTANGATFTA
jgi:hypothetical protein